MADPLTNPSCPQGTTAPCKNTGKGTQVAIQPACGFTSQGLEELLTAPDVAIPGGTWCEMGCLYTAQPPADSFDNITGELCLNESANPTTELGDLQADNPTFTIPFCPGDDEYKALREHLLCQTCFVFCYIYPDGGVHLFYGYLQEITPDEISRNDFMRTTVTILRTSQVFCAVGDLVTGSIDNFDCAGCRPNGTASVSAVHGGTITATATAASTGVTGATGSKNSTK